ncbi:MAG: non-homologous end-joining DNA ligase [Acidobacteria bacterium]|nr:non-homologous end-joining DNA ligase [Acidobacteriota bacterium]
MSSAPEGEGWIYEVKLDGYRAIAVKDGQRAALLSRHGNELNARFPAIAAALRDTRFNSATLDGEIVALDEQGRPSFQELQNSRTTRLPIVYYVFDLLNYGGCDLQKQPLSKRRAVLETLRLVEPIRLAAVLDSDVNIVLAEIRRRHLEGIVAKRRDSFYEAGKRSANWQKVRVAERDTFVIGGYLPAGKTFEALLVGRWRGKQLYFVKKLRAGFGPRTRDEVMHAVENLRIPQCPFVNLPEPSSHRGAVDRERMKLCVWVQPKVECEVEYAEQTRDGRLRHAAFRQLLPPSTPRAPR